MIKIAKQILIQQQYNNLNCTVWSFLNFSTHGIKSNRPANGISKIIISTSKI